MELWIKNGRMGLSTYSEKEARGYVKRQDRPQHLTFLDHIHLFLSSSSSSSSSSSRLMNS
ncbi:Nucleosome assembly protein 1 [Prunus dulcis]|nr:Nucleosome assembly protein 1 [Prunus dulcis]